MARGGTCSTCGASLPRGAAYCPACGRRTTEAAVVFEAWDDDDPGGPDDEGTATAAGAPVGGGDRRRGWLIGIGIATAVLVGALAVGLSRREDDGARTAATRTTVAPVTTSPTTAPAPVTIRPAPRTTLEPSTTTSAAAPRPGPVLGEAVGLTLEGLIDDGASSTRFQLDLDTNVASTNKVSLIGRARRIMVRAGGLVLTGANSVVLLRDDGSTVVLADNGHGVVTFPGPAEDQVWVYDLHSYLPEVRLFRTPSGALAQQVPLPPRSALVGLTPDGALLLGAQDGGTFAFDPGTGRAQRVSAGRVLALGRTVVIEDVCSDTLSCVVFATNLTTGARVPLDRFVGPHLAELAGSSVPAMLSPDERYLLAWEQAGAPFPIAAAVLDVTTGRTVLRRALDLAELQLAAAWTPDSRWLLLKSRAGIDALAVTQPEEPARTLPIPGLALDRLVSFALVPKP